MLRFCAATATQFNKEFKDELLLLLRQSSASLFTAVTHNAKSTVSKSQLKVMGKLFGNRLPGSKKRWYPSAETVPSQNLNITGTGIGRKQGKNTVRRMTVLNKLFMTHITDLLATGEASEKILGRGLQVTRVKTSPDFTFVSVFWIGSGTPDADAELEVELHRCSGLLRHELSQLRLMGEVPRIKFVRDKALSNVTQVEALLRTMDFGENYEGSDAAEDELRRDFQWKPLEPNTTQESDAEQPDINVIRFSEMRHDVLGLDHRDIMSKILTKMRKSKHAWELHEDQNSQRKTSPSTLEDDSVSRLESINRKLAEAAAVETKFGRFLANRKTYKNTPERKKFRKEEPLLSVQEDEADLEEMILHGKYTSDDADYIEEDDQEKI